TAHLFAPNWRTGPAKTADEKKWRVKQAETEFERGGCHPQPAGRSRNDKRPEFFVPLGGQVGVMQLVPGPVEAETHKTEDPDDGAVYLVQSPGLSKQPVRGLMKANQKAMHEVAAD